MLSGDPELLIRCIAREVYHFHSVKKWLRYGIYAVCCANEHYIRKVIRNVHVMVGKGVVLLRVKDFKKRTGRISVVGLGELVDLI